MCKFVVDTKREGVKEFVREHSKILPVVAGGSLEGVGTVFYISH